MLSSQLTTRKFFSSQLTDSQLASSHFRITQELDRPYLHEKRNVARFSNVRFLLGKIYISKWSHFSTVFVNKFLYFSMYFRGTLTKALKTEK